MNISYRQFILPMALTALAARAEHPNFIVILVDDLGWADVQCNNPESFYETPNINCLAQSGVRFANGYSAHPVCSPTRAALLTGKHPNRINITDWLPGDDPQNRPLIGPKDENQLAIEEVTLAEKLKENGYATCFVGKWHLGHNEEFWPENQGFDINIGGWSAGQPRIIHNVANGYYSPYGNPRMIDGPEGEYLTDRLTEVSLSFIRNNQDTPFLLYLSYYTVHTPIQAAQKHISRFTEKRQLMSIDTVTHIREGEGWTKVLQENAEYASMVAALDENVGRLIQEINNVGLGNNTWVIFTSDNGGLSTLHRQNAPTANGHLRAGKGWCYEGGIRVPLIITGPGVVNGGRSVIYPAVSMDIFTTILSLAGVDHEMNDGIDLLPVLRDEKSPAREVLFWHYPHYHGSAWKPGSAIRKNDWKLLWKYEEQSTELYNLADDPGEVCDMAGIFPEKVAELKRLLFENLEQTNALFPVPNPEFRPE